MRAVILAGGKGTRLSPYTSVFPKPLMPIDGMPILNVVISQLEKHGFHHITLAVGHMADMIKTYFGNGNKFSVKIDYSHEDRPLGTVGPLSLIKDLSTDFLVMNGDILTDLNFAEFLSCHRKHGACATVGTYSKKVEIEYGIVETNHGNEIIGYNEKPTLDYQVSMGIYAFNTKILSYITRGQHLDFPDLVSMLLRKGEQVIRYPFDGYWMDVGCHADYEKAAKDFEEKKEYFLGQLPLATYRKAAVQGR
jgi:NDP-sugar pyrophosphorylase family protein